MVAKPDRIKQAAQAIEAALLKLIREPEKDYIRVSENDWGHLEIIVASDVFKGKDEDDRDDLVWKHLRENLDRVHFSRLADVAVMDLAELAEFRTMEKWIDLRARGNSEGLS